MEYVFFAPYWLFCVARVIMTASFGHANFGLFKNFLCLYFGFFGFIVWCLLIVALIRFGTMIEALISKPKDTK